MSHFRVRRDPLANGRIRASGMGGAIVAAIVVSASCAGTPTARDRLAAATESIGAVPSVSYQYVYEGTGTAAGSHSGTVRLIPRRGASPLYWAELRPAPSWDPAVRPVEPGHPSPALFLSSGGEHVAARDEARSQFRVGTVSGGSGHLVAAAPLAVLFEFNERDPFAAEMSGELVLEPQETVGGVLCDVIRGTSDEFGPADIWWYIGVEDDLPRAFRWISKQADAPGEFFFEIEDLEATRELPLQSLQIAQRGDDELIDEDTRLVQVGVAAPEWTLAGDAGQLVRSSDLDGSVVVLGFWASWCAPCDPMLDELARLSRTFESEGVRFFALETWDDRRDRAAAEVGSGDVPILRRAERLAIDYRLSELPALFVIDRQGSLVHVSNPVSRDAATEAGEVEASIRAALSR